MPRLQVMRVGRDYETSEWLNFLVEPEAKVTDEMRLLGGSVEWLANMCWRWWQVEAFGKQKFVDCNDDIDWSYLGYLCHQSLSGAGVGLWDHEDSFIEWLGVDKDEAESIAKALEVFIETSNRECAVALQLFSSELDDLIGKAQWR